MSKCALCKALEEKGEYRIDGNWTVLEIKKDSDGIGIYAYGEGIASMKANYCPECGRKLGDNQ